MFMAPAFAQETEAGQDAEALAPETHSEVGVEHDAGGVFPPFDSSTFPSQLLWLAITFGLFYLFMKRVIVPRMQGILETRSGRIAADLDQAAKLKEEADAAIAAYEQALAEARANANAIGQKARDEAKAEAEAARKEVEAGLEKKLAEAEERIAAIKASAMQDVGAIAETTAQAILERLVGKADKTAVAHAVKAAR